MSGTEPAGPAVAAHPVETATVIFVDLSGSSRRLVEDGERVGVPERRARMGEIEQTVLGIVPGARRVGTRQGDGWFFLAPMAAVPLAVEAALVLLAVPHIRLPLRVAVGAGLVEWDGVGPDATPNGSVIDLTARLLSVCPPGALAVTESVHAALLGRPALRGLLREQASDVRGFGCERYWLATPGDGGEGGEAGMNVFQQGTRPGGRSKVTERVVLGVVAAALVAVLASGAVRYGEYLNEEIARVSGEHRRIEGELGQRSLAIELIKQRLASMDEKLADQSRKIDELLRRR